MSELNEYIDKLNIRKLTINASKYIINFDNQKYSANQFAFDYNITFYPTLLLFNNKGELLEKIIGVVSKDFYWRNLDKIIDKYNI